MIKPAIPRTEATRQSTLDSLEILDTGPDERFDRLTRLCMRMFDVPIALVSLVDGRRQWFKSCCGLEVSETPRDISFCGHAILGDDIFIIPDATQDDRFHDNPLVTDAPHIRFYAGVPLEVGGCKLGTLCIIDHRPRDFDAADIRIMRDLAAMVEAEIAAHQLSTIDELTRLSNKRGFDALAEHYLNFCRRESSPASLVFIDLNDFKPINDTFGHAEGDRALVTLADMMTHYFRQTDLIARLGGDEFVVLLSKTAEANAVETMASFCRKLDKHNEESAQAYDLSLSYGIVEFDPDRHAGIDAMLRDGDSRMYAHKQELKAVSGSTR